MSVVPSATYSITASWFHWLVAVPLIGTVGTVLKAQSVPKEDKEEKGKWMFRHKSLGLLAGMIVVPRMAYRLLDRSAYNVAKIQGTSGLEEVASKATHYMLYAFMTIMPATGIAMGLYGGKGLPFFYTTLPAFEKSNGEIAKQSYNIHKQLGVYGKYLIPIHGGAAFLHYFRGHTIFTRVNPFRATRA